MENNIPKALTALLTAGQDAVNGATQYGVAIGLVHNTQADLEAVVAALVTARDAHEAGKVSLRSKRAVANSVADTGKGFLVLMRDTLKRTLGNRYSQAWDAAGFTGGSLMVPSSPAKVQPRLQAAQAYLLANTSAQVEALNITADRAGALFGNVRDARGAVDTQETVVGDLKTARDTAAKELRKTLRALINELSQLIDPLDQRWLAFGLNKPGAEETPEIPANVRVTLLNNSAAAVNWGHAARARYYRVWKRLIGVDTDLVAVGSPTGTTLTIGEIPAHAQVQIALSAVNDGGESPKSDAVTITMP